MSDNNINKDLYCTFQKFVLIRFIQRNQGHRDSVIHEFSAVVKYKVTIAVTKVRTTGEGLPLDIGEFALLLTIASFRDC